MTVKLNNRKIQSIEMYIDTNDYPKFTDSYVTSAIFADTGENLTDKELEILNENQELVYDLVLEYLY